MKVTTEYPTYSRMISFTCAIACPAGASSASATSSKRRNSSHIISFRSLDLLGLSSKSKFTVAAKDTDFEHLGHCFNILESSSCITMPFCYCTVIRRVLQLSKPVLQLSRPRARPLEIGSRAVGALQTLLLLTRVPACAQTQAFRQGCTALLVHTCEVRRKIRRLSGVI